MKHSSTNQLYGGGGSGSEEVDSDVTAVSKKRKIYPRAISEATYSELVKLLKGQLNTAYQDMNTNEKSAYKFAHRHGKKLTVNLTFDPLAGRQTERVCYSYEKDKIPKLIVLKSSEVDRVINLYHERSKVDGARKLYKTITEIYCGVSECQIQSTLNRSSKRQELKPTFRNKAPLKPVESSGVWKQVQADLVSMEQMPSTVGNTTYKYILSVIDVFSRFLILRPLTSKSSQEISDILTVIFAEHGAPERFQTDQGTEFSGCVTTLMAKLKVHIIRSRPYHPQSQGKDERSHRTWKDYLRHDLKDDPQTNWVVNLPVYMSLYNASPHRSIGLKTPFEVHFGRKPLSSKRPLFTEPTTSGSESEDSDLPDYSNSTTKSAATVSPIQSIRDEARVSSRKASRTMIERQLSVNPPSLYDVGDTVLVRLPIRKGKGKARKTCKGSIVKADHTKHAYVVAYEDSGQNKSGHFSVSDITSESLDVENQRPKAIAPHSKRFKTVTIDTSLVPGSTMFRLRTSIGTHDFKYSDLSTITTHNAWLTDEHINIFIGLLRNHQIYDTTSVNVVPVLFYTAVRDEMTLTCIALWQKYSITEKCVSSSSPHLLCIPIIEQYHFFVIVVDLVNRSMEILDSIQRSKNSSRYLHAVIVLTAYLDSMLPGQEDAKSL